MKVTSVPLATFRLTLTEQNVRRAGCARTINRHKAAPPAHNPAPANRFAWLWEPSNRDWRHRQRTLPHELKAQNRGKSAQAEEFFRSPGAADFLTCALTS